MIWYNVLLLKLKPCTDMTFFHRMAEFRHFFPPFLFVTVFWGVFFSVFAVFRNILLFKLTG